MTMRKDGGMHCILENDYVKWLLPAFLKMSDKSNGGFKLKAEKVKCL